MVPGLKAEITADGLSKLSKSFFNSLPVDLNLEPKFEEFEVIIVLDANNLEQLGRFGVEVKKSKLPVVIVDHHKPPVEKGFPVALDIVDDKARSTCEIVYRLYEEAGVKVEGDLAEAIFLGIAFDTQLFRYANAETFLIVSELVKAGLKPEKLLDLFTSSIDNPERIARIKASKRAKTLMLNGWLIAISHVSSYQASAARALINLGYHLSIVCGERSGRVQVSLRCTREFHEKTGIDLALDLAEPLGKLLKGAGGGHSTSAGVNGYGSLERAMELCESILKELLTTRK